jgi:uncharacterized membrane protein
VNEMISCSKILDSEYANIVGIPIALLGVVSKIVFFGGFFFVFHMRHSFKYTHVIYLELAYNISLVNI